MSPYGSKVIVRVQEGNATKNTRRKQPYAEVRSLKSQQDNQRVKALSLLKSKKWYH
jgi:hypothetical protein